MLKGRTQDKIHGDKQYNTLFLRVATKPKRMPEAPEANWKRYSEKDMLRSENGLHFAIEMKELALGEVPSGHQCFRALFGSQALGGKSTPHDFCWSFDAHGRKNNTIGTRITEKT